MRKIHEHKFTQIAIENDCGMVEQMDKRSVLVDALAYLRSIHEEIDQIQSELKERSLSSSSFSSGYNLQALPDKNSERLKSSRPLAPSPRNSSSKPEALIIEVSKQEREMIRPSSALF